MSTGATQECFVVPLSIQKDGDYYIVGNTIGEFYQFPEQAVKILGMLASGDTVDVISSRIEVEYAEKVDVEDFVGQLSAIGFIHPEQHRQNVMEPPLAVSDDRRRVFSVSPWVAKAAFSVPVQLCGLAALIYAGFIMITYPALRVNFNAFYTERNRTLLLLVLLILTAIQVAMHETGHMLAAARHGIKSRYALSNRLWNVVAESDLTGILALPKSQRYFPMLAGLLVDILCISVLTILLQTMLQNGVGTFATQVVQALILEILISIAWQFNIFVKTDVYFVVCNYFAHPDLDRDARIYLSKLLFAASSGLLGSNAENVNFQNLNILRVFSGIWLFGRVLSLILLFGVFLPTMTRYIESSFRLLSGPPPSIWIACDKIAYASITMTMFGLGIYMWIKQRVTTFHQRAEKTGGPDNWR